MKSHDNYHEYLTWNNLISHRFIHGLKNNTRLTRFFNPTKKKNIWWHNWQSANGGISVLCLTNSRNAFVLGCIWLKLNIDDNLSQIQRETNAFLILVRHNTEILPFADCQLCHQMFFFFVGLKNRVNLVLFFKPWVHQLIIRCYPLYESA